MQKLKYLEKFSRIFSKGYGYNSQANVWAEDYLGRQALHLAAQVGTSEAVMLLVKLGADPNQVGSHQMTPLHYAAKVTVCLLKLHNDLLLTGGSC